MFKTELSADQRTEPHVTPPTVLYLGGLGRSGSTLIERVLGRLPGYCAAGELVHLWRWGVEDNENCSCGTPFGRCVFWREVGRAAFGAEGWTAPMAVAVQRHRGRIDRTRRLPVLAAPTALQPRRAELAGYVQGYRRLYTAIAEVSGASVVVDSSKHPSLAYCLRHQTDLDVRLIHLVRDSRGVAYSWTKEMSRPQAAVGGARMTRYSPARSAALWNVDNAALLALGRLGMPRLLLRYEDFITDPTAQTARLSAFAGSPATPEALAFLGPAHADLIEGHGIAGNPMRFRSGRIALYSDDAWRAKLPASQARTIAALTAPLMIRFGYSLRAAAC